MVPHNLQSVQFIVGGLDLIRRTQEWTYRELLAQLSVSVSFPLTSSPSHFAAGRLKSPAACQPEDQRPTWRRTHPSLGKM